MRKATLLAVVGLAVLAALAPGCCCLTSCPDPGTKALDGGKSGGPGTIPGVVEIYRSEDDKTVVGYMSIDPGNPNTAWWLLNGTENPPLMPNDTAPNANAVGYRATAGHDEKMNGATLCATFKDKLMSPRLWWTVRGAAQCP